MKVTIELPDTHEVHRSGTQAVVDLATLPKQIVANLVLHGLTQKVGDAAAGAVSTTFGEGWADQAADVKAAFKTEHADDIRKTAQGDMEAVVKQLTEGVWGVSRAGTGMSPVEREMISIIRPQAKASDAERYKNADEGERVAMCQKYIGKLSDEQRDTLERHAKGRIDLREKEKAALAGLDLAI